jgi:hypothetical protein
VLLPAYACLGRSNEFLLAVRHAGHAQQHKEDVAHAAMGHVDQGGAQGQHVALQADVEAVKNAVTGMSDQEINDACTCNTLLCASVHKFD